MEDKNSKIVCIYNIKGEDGKTDKERNLALQHNIPVGSLVEVKHDEWHGDGACFKTHARLWVIEQGRDCDGTPLYWLSKDKLHKKDTSNEFILYKNERPDGSDFILNNESSVNIIHNVVGGFIEESLTVIEVTKDIEDGKGALSWRQKKEN